MLYSSVGKFSLKLLGHFKQRSFYDGATMNREEVEGIVFLELQISTKSGSPKRQYGRKLPNRYIRIKKMHSS